MTTEEVRIYQLATRVANLAGFTIPMDRLGEVEAINIPYEFLEASMKSPWLLKSATVLNTNTFTVDTTDLLVGQALKFRILYVYYYGIIESIGTGTITISGNKSLSGTVQEFYYAINKVITTTYVIDDSTVESVGTDIQRREGNVPIKLESGHIVAIEAYCHAGSDLKLKIMNGSNHIFNTDSEGLICVAQTFTTTGVGLNSAYTLFNANQELTIDIVKTGTGVVSPLVTVKQVIGL